MKRFKKLISIITVIAMLCSTFVMNFNTLRAAEEANESEITNLAKYCEVEISSGEKGYYLTNGAINNTYWKGLSKTAYATVVLPWTATIHEIKVVTYFNDKSKWYTFEVFVSEDNATWTSVGKQELESNPGNVGYTFTLAQPVQAKYVKVQGINTNNGDRFDLVEIEAYGTIENIAKNKAIASNYAGTQKDAVDGDLGTYWDTASTADNTIWATLNDETYPYALIDLGGIYDLDAVDVIPYINSGRYYKYKVYTSLDGTNFTLLGEKNNENKSIKGDVYQPSAETFEARYIKVVGTYNSANGSFHLVEVMAKGTLLEEAKDAPVTLTYEFSGDQADKAGYGEGTIQITPSGFDMNGNYVLYWANEAGVLAGYEHIVSLPATGSTVTFEMVDGIAIPYGATKLVAFKSNTTTVASPDLANAIATFEIPESKQFKNNNVEFSFASVSDVHINFESVHPCRPTEKWIDALNFFDQLGLEKVVVSGDMTGDGTVSEFEAYVNASKQSTYDFEDIIEGRGNHETQDTENFYNYTSSAEQVHPYEKSPYFHVLVEGDEGEKDNLFIVMTQEIPSTSASNTADNFSTAQLDWFESLLVQYSGTNTNIFVVCHGYFKNWGPGDRVNGLYSQPMILSESFPGNMRFKALLEEYKEVVTMSGHTHFGYVEMVNYSDENGTAARMIHNSSVGRVRAYTASGTSTSFNVAGKVDETVTSEGYAVYVYDDAIVYNGYNLATKEIMPLGCYIMESYVQERKEVTSIEIAQQPDKTEYKIGQSFDKTGMVVNAIYTDGTSEEITSYSVVANNPLTLDDTSVTIKYQGYEVTLPITVTDMFKGKGTKEDPYLIETAEDFFNFTNQASTITTSHDTEAFGKGLYFAQTADIDMAGYPGYEGTDANGNKRLGISGVYDGQGHTINVDINTDTAQISVFPYVNGVLMNVKITGKIHAGESAQAVRTLGKNGVAVNCKFDLSFSFGTSSSATKYANGFTNTCYGYVYQVYNLYTSVADEAYAFTKKHDNDTVVDVYYDSYDKNGTALTDSKATRSSDGVAIANNFNDHTKVNAQTALAKMQAVCPEITLDDLCLWTTDGSAEMIPLNDYVEADYSAVDAAIAAIPAGLLIYTEESVAALNSAVNAVVRGLKGSQQAEVDAMAQAINDAITALEKEQVFEMTNFKAEALDYKTIQLSWDALKAANVYVVERLTSEGDWIELATITDTTYVASGVKTGKAYTYRVKAMNDTAQTEYAETTAQTTLTGEIELTLTNNGINKFDLAWNEVAGATRYIIYRKANDGEWKKVLTLGKDARSYTSNAMLAGTYTYVVKAARYDSTERVMGPTSNEVAGVSTFDAINVTLSNVDQTTVQLSWNKIEGVKYYEVYRVQTESYGEVGSYRLLKRTTALETTCTSLNPEKTYSFKVRGYNIVNGQKVYTEFSESVANKTFYIPV